MEKESEYLFHLLGAYIRGAAPRGAEGMDLEKLRYLARIHSVTGVFGHMAVKYGLFPEDAARLRRECMLTINSFGQRAALAEMIFEALDRERIDHIPVKGCVVKDYYPVPELRTFGDIDVVIRPADRQKCHALMCGLGYQVKTDWEPVYSYVRSMEHYEFHTELMETDICEELDCRDYFRDLWKHARSVGSHRYRLTPEYHFVYLLAHLAKHVAAAGAGARLYMDLAVFILHFSGDMDWAWIRRELEKTRLMCFANTALTFVERYFDVASPIALEPVDEEVLEALADTTAGGGIFGKAGLDSGVSTLRRQAEETARIGTVFRRLFPAAKTIESRYTYLRGKPWLLPAAWIHRLVRTRKNWGDHAREARSILRADLKKVRKIRQLHRSIGLRREQEK